MASILDSLFGKKVSAPDAVTVDATAEAKKASAYNQEQLTNFQGYSADTVKFMQNLINTTNPNISGALNTNYNLGTELATTGTTKAARGALDYYRRIGLETAAATGAPVSSQFSQNYGGSFGASQILANQTAGSNILATNTNQNMQLLNTELSPALSTLNASYASPSSFISAAQTNAGAVNQSNLIKAQADSSASPFGNFIASLLSQTAGYAAGQGIKSAFAA